jgi:hypothetical protein
MITRSFIYLLLQCTLSVLPSNKRIGILMLAGGHFAGACFDGFVNGYNATTKVK